MDNKIIADGPICSLEVAASDILSVIQKNGEIVVTLKDGSQKQIASSSGDASALSVQLASGELYTAYEMGAMFAMETSEELYAESIQEAALEQTTPEEQAQAEDPQNQQPPELNEAPEGTEEQALMDQLAEELAEVETAAGDDGAAGGSGGYGFNSNFASQNVEGIDDIGALGETELQYGLGEFGDKSFAANAAPIQPTLTLLDPETGLPLEGSYEVLEDGTIQLLLQAVPDSDNGILTITIKGIPPSWTVTGEGTYNPSTQTWTFTSVGGQTFTGGPIVTPPADSDVDLTGLIFTVVEYDPVSGLRGTATTTVDVIVDAVADPAEITAQDSTGLEDTAVDVIFTGAAGDKDGSEVVVKYVVSGVPDGFSLNAGTNLGNGVWELTPQQANGLKLNPPANFYGDVSLSVTVHTAETVTDKDFDLTNNTATATTDLCVTFTPAADPPIVGVDLPDVPGVGDPAAKVYEDGTVKVNFHASLAETASPTEFLTVTITGVNLTLLAPNSFEITGQNGAVWVRVPGSPDTAATFTLTLPAGVGYQGSMQFTPKANSDLDLSDIKVSATSTEPTSNTTANSNVEQFDVIVDAVADKPNLDVTYNAGVEGGKPADLIIKTTLADTDGSESVVKYVINGVPNGFSLSSGTNLGNGSWELTPAQINDLKINPPQNFYGSVNLAVIVHTEEGVTDQDFDLTNNTNKDAQEICVTFSPSADPPTVKVDLPKGPECGCPGNPGLVAQVYEDNSVKVNFSADRAPGASPTEFLTVTVTGVNLTLLAPNSFAITGIGNAVWTRVPGTSDANASFKITLPAGTNYQGSMKFVPEANSDIDLSNIKVSAVATEPQSNTTANSNVEEFDVIVDAVADKPLVTAHDVHLGNGATSVAIDIDVGLSDKDGSESITHIQISGVPGGFTFNKGVNLGGGIWQFEPADLTGLKIIASNPNYNGTLNLVATAFNKEKVSDKDFNLNNNTNHASDGFKVTFNAPPVAKDNTYKLFELPGNAATGNVGDTFITHKNGKTVYQMTGGATVYKDTGSDSGGFWYKLPILSNDSDPNGDPLKITKIYNIQGLSKNYSVEIDPTGKFLIVKIGQDGNGKDTTFTLEYQITDGNGGYDTAKVTVCIADHNSPLVFDLDGDGVELLSNENGVLFDIDNDGTQDKVGWANKDDGLLAMDINGDGVINNQSELFGNNTEYADGFANLAQYDDNGDGKIDAMDAAFQNLLIWQDANSDGFSQSGEMFSLVYLNIASISLSAQEVAQTLEGNQISHIGEFTFNDGTTGEVVDAWFETTSPETSGPFTAQEGLSDLFVFEAGGNPSQMVEHFNSDEGDVLDISALLADDFDPLQDAINEFVFATTTADGDTVLSVDADGAAGPGAAVQFATLVGVTTTVDELVNNNNIAT